MWPEATVPMDNHLARLDATANILTALANLHEMGDSTEQEVCMVLNLLAYAIRHGKTAQMEAQYALMADRWLAETEQELEMPEANL